MSDPHGSVRWVAVSWKTATRERLLEASLSDLHSQINFVLSIGKIVHYVCDMVTNRIQFLKNGRRTFGRTGIRYEELLDMVHPDDRDRVAGFRSTAVDMGGEPAEIDLRYRHPDGRLLTFRIRAIFEPGLPGRNDRLTGVAILLKEEASLDRESEPLTGVQVRAARGMLGWSVNELAGRSKVSASTIIRTEAEPGVPKGKTSCLDALRHALQSGGVRFFVDGNGKPALSFQAQDPPGPGHLPAS